MYLSLGLMSGTSMDGIDAALIQTDGQNHIEYQHSASLTYAPAFSTLLKSTEYAVRSEAGNLDAAATHFQKHLQDYLLTHLHTPEHQLQKQLNHLALYLYQKDQAIEFQDIITHSTELHAEVVKELLQNTNQSQVHIIGYHGQTVYHKPERGITHQLGSGEYLAKLTGLPVIDTFRQADVDAGGQGAPFAPIFHQALSIRDQHMPAAIVNLGGIANVTFITDSDPENIIGFDTGPANALLDRFVRQQSEGLYQMDEDGRFALQGNINGRVLKRLYQHALPNRPDFFTHKPPKSLDIGDLQLIPELDSLSLEDGAATLAAFTADTIVESLHFITKPYPEYWILCGGGAKHPVIKRELEKRLLQKAVKQVTLTTDTELGWINTEAQLMAYLAVRSLLGLPLSYPNTTRVPKPQTGGRLHPKA